MTKNQYAESRRRQKCWGCGKQSAPLRVRCTACAAIAAARCVTYRAARRKQRIKEARRREPDDAGAPS
jgi:hypothetical protein